MTIEPIGAVRPVPTSNADSHPEFHEPHQTLVRQRIATDRIDDRVVPAGASPATDEGTDAARIVPALLALHGLDPSPAEVSAIAARFAAARKAVRSLYAVPEARNEDPGLIFHAAP